MGLDARPEGEVVRRTKAGRKLAFSVVGRARRDRARIALRRGSRCRAGGRLVLSVFGPLSFASRSSVVRTAGARDTSMHVHGPGGLGEWSSKTAALSSRRRAA